MSSTAAPSPGVVERVQNFVQENKKAVLIGAAVAAVAIGGVAYYAASSSSEQATRKKDKKKSKSKKKKSSSDDGPLLEEVKPKVERDRDVKPKYEAVKSDDGGDEGWGS